MKNINISFNNQMRIFRQKYEQKYLKRDMASYWRHYQRKRFKETYYPVFKKNNNKISSIKMVLELLRLWIKWKCIPYHYFRYSLYDSSFKRNEIDNYLPETVFYYSILPKINSEYFLLDNKITTNDILLANGIPIPKCILKVINKHIFDGNGKEIICEDELVEYLGKFSCEIISKYSNCGSGGKQIHCFKKTNGVYKSEEVELTFLTLLERYDNWLFQEKVYNDESISSIYSLSLNTFRVISYLKNGEVNILYAILKFGSNGFYTDNAHTDGMYINVDLKTGITDGLAYNENLESFEIHPYTKKRLHGLKIPNFHEVLDLAKKCALLFPTLSFIGWDIALTKNGLVVLEGNSSPGLTIIQRTNRGMKQFLRLYYDKD